MTFSRPGRNLRAAFSSSSIYNLTSIHSYSRSICNCSRAQVARHRSKCAVHLGSPISSNNNCNRARAACKAVAI